MKILLFIFFKKLKFFMNMSIAKFFFVVIKAVCLALTSLILCNFKVPGRSNINNKNIEVFARLSRS